MDCSANETLGLTGLEVIWVLDQMKSHFIVSNILYQLFVSNYLYQIHCINYSQSNNWCDPEYASQERYISLQWFSVSDS